MQIALKACERPQDSQLAQSDTHFERVTALQVTLQPDSHHARRHSLTYTQREQSGSHYRLTSS
jgi:hypothetical protein